MDTVCSLQYKPGVLLGKSIYFIFYRFPHRIVMHSQEICGILRNDLNQALNRSTPTLTP